VPIAGNLGSIQNVLNSIPDSARGPISHIVQPLNYYWLGSFKVQENDWAGYAMAKLGGDRWKATVGLRIVDTDEQAFVNSPNPTSTSSPYITTSAFGNYYVNDVKHNYLDALPSINFMYKIKDDVIFRAAAAKAMSRPDFSALGGTVSLNDITTTGQGGNANLKPVRSTNYDASLAWYYGKLSNVVVDVFYMDLQSYVDYGISSQVYKNQYLTGNSPTAVYSTYQISAPVNVSGQVQGYEISWQTPIKYGFGFLANYAYADGETSKGTPLIGDAKNTVNATGYFENKWLSVRLAYTYRTKVYVGIDRASAEVQLPTDSLDAAVNVKLTPNLSLTAQGLNLTNSLLKYTTGNPSQPRATYDNGTQIYFGLRAKF
jgi:iron complex outermembrane receptor protein